MPKCVVFDTGAVERESENKGAQKVINYDLLVCLRGEMKTNIFEVIIA